MFWGKNASFDKGKLMNKLRRTLLAAPLLLAALGGPALRAEPLSLGQISDFWNGLQTAEGTFTQIASDGTMSTGTLYIKRPGRIRFEYDPPEEAMVIAGGGSLAIFDPRSNTGPDRYPLSETPLSIILRRDVDLTDERMVVDHRSDGATTQITLQDPDHPEYGNIKLVFTDPPMLNQWIVTDNAGGQTTMVLNTLRIGGRVPERLFNIIAEERDWQK